MTAPLQGTVVSVDVEPGAMVRAGEQIAVLEAMKMEHQVCADQSGIVRVIATEPGVGYRLTPEDEA